MITSCPSTFFRTHNTGFRKELFKTSELCFVTSLLSSSFAKKVREKSRECHNHKPQPFPNPKRKRKPTNLNKHKPNKRTKSTKISSLFPKRGNRNTKRTEKYKNKMANLKTTVIPAGIAPAIATAIGTAGISEAAPQPTRPETI